MDGPQSWLETLLQIRKSLPLPCIEVRARQPFSLWAVWAPVMKKIKYVTFYLTTLLIVSSTYWVGEIPGPVALHLYQNPSGQAWVRNRASAVRKMEFKTTGGREQSSNIVFWNVGFPQSEDLCCPVRTVVGIRLVCDLAPINLRGQRSEDVLRTFTLESQPVCRMWYPEVLLLYLSFVRRILVLYSAIRLGHNLPNNHLTNEDCLSSYSVKQRSLIT